jgi:transposase InsO family protein
MTDNGSAYRSKLFGEICAAAEARHVRTRPYTPRTNGKAERFIQTSLREWASAKSYETSEHRNQAMPPWIDIYNLTRPHAGISGQTHGSGSTICLETRPSDAARHLSASDRR